jgi:endonuclease I
MLKSVHWRLPRARLAGAAISMLCVCSSAQADVFINEFHYDNSGTDTGERVEVIAPSGTSLAGWTVVLYNGGDGRQYATLNLSGTAANQCGGHGTVVVNATTAGIQNGDPDGLALVDASGAVVQFLSYEGSFSAIDGPAAGRTSSPISTAETSTTPVGQSLQLAGSGSRAQDFSWQSPRASSFGSCNSGQTLVGGGGGGTGGGTLSNGVTRTGLTATAGSALDFTLSVPAGASNLRFAMSGGSGDGDLFVRFGSAPTATSYDCRPFLSGNAETCTFASPAAGTWHVRISAYTSFSAVSLLPSFDTASGGGGTGYYAGVVTSSASALRSSLHALIDDHTRIPYTASTTDTWDVLNRAEQDPLNSGRILDIYKNTSYAKVAGGNDFYNREHTWPNSLGFPDDGGTNSAYTDLHMLMASDIAYNAARGNKPYDNCPSGCTEYPTAAYAGQGGGSGSYPGNSNWSNASVFQVWTKLKGNVARAMFYMDLRYEGGSHGGTGAAEPDLRLTDTLSLVSPTGSNAAVGYMGRLSTLIQWHQQDPPDEAERLRNALIQTYQGNRNPFVDNPAWVACVYQSVCS